MDGASLDHTQGIDFAGNNAYLFHTTWMPSTVLSYLSWRVISAAIAQFWVSRFAPTDPHCKLSNFSCKLWARLTLVLLRLKVCHLSSVWNSNYKLPPVLVWNRNYTLIVPWRTPHQELQLSHQGCSIRNYTLIALNVIGKHNSKTIQSKFCSTTQNQFATIFLQVLTITLNFVRRESNRYRRYPTTL